MTELHIEILQQPQRQLWEMLQQKAAFLSSRGFYLAGGTALALSIGHRESQDFDFFSQMHDIEPIRTWIEATPNAILRDVSPDTIHAEIDDVKLSFIAGYRYPLLLPATLIENMNIADILDIGLMKMLAITHRATIRDYLDLAIILRDYCPLQQLIEKSTEKYGPTFNVMLCLRAMLHFDDLDLEMPLILDSTLQTSWKKILQDAVKKMTAE